MYLGSVHVLWPVVLILTHSRTGKNSRQRGLAGAISVSVCVYRAAHTHLTESILIAWLCVVRCTLIECLKVHVDQVVMCCKVHVDQVVMCCKVHVDQVVMCCKVHVGRVLKGPR